MDLLTPIIFGAFNFLLNSEKGNNEHYILLAIVFSTSVLILSFIKNYYKDYYLIDFSQKIKISVVTWIFAIFIQLVTCNYLSIKIDIFLLISWLLIPLVILLIKYYIKLNSRHVIKYPIHLIGKLYTFNDHEIRMLTDKGFLVFFHESLDDFFDKNPNKNESIAVLNLSIQNLSTMDNDKYDLRKRKVYKLDQFFEKYLRKIYTYPNENLYDIYKYDRFNYFLKRLIDIFSVIILFPVLLIISIFMFILKKVNKIDESIFYKQKRYGLKNKPFDIYKLRTMRIDSSLKGNTRQNDPRIYPFARVIRNLRLDELPQILNILSGHMHLVGPRAEWVKLSDEYNRKILNYSSRHIVKPGITGWAQIAYPYGVDAYDAEQKLMYDIYYIKNWSIWLEVEICFKTLLVILDKKGF